MHFFRPKPKRMDTPCSTAVYIFVIVSLSPYKKVPERIDEGAGLPDPRHDGGSGRVGGTEEGIGVADNSGATAGDGGEDDKGNKYIYVG